MDSEFDFWKTSESEIEVDESVKSTEVAIPPQFDESMYIPDVLTKSWVEAQLPASVWNRHKSMRLNPQLIVEMSKTAGKTPSKRGLMARFGFGVRTYYDWEHRAARGEQPYALWHQCIMHGVSQIEEEMLDNVRGHALTDWKAAAWLLARVNRDEFGEKQATTQIELNSGGASKVTINRITNDDAMAIANIMNEIGALPPGTGEDVVDGEVVGESDAG